MANTWFRLYSEFATDAKVQMLPESYQRRLIMLFCIRCNGNVTLHDEEVTFMLRISNDEWQKTKAIFITKKFINEHNEILNWDKRQFVSDSSAERVARHRNKMKQECNVTVTPPDTEQIQNRTDTEKAISAKKFAPPPNVDPQLIAEFKKVRKAALTQKAFEGIEREAAKAGISTSQAIQICIERGWRGFNADWDWKPKARASPSRSVQEARLSVADQIMGGRNGKGRKIIEINPRPADSSGGEDIQQVSGFLRQPASG